MRLHFPTGPCAGQRRRRRAAGVAMIATAVAVAGLGASPTASSAPSSTCPTTLPVSELTSGQNVHGLTVTSGAEPSGFTGTILGVLDDGIAPGVDMIMAELSSPTIAKTGIWQGMSGSPVYAADGRLIGAVAYGLAFGPSPVAGLTPAAEMLALLEDGGSAARRTLERVGAADEVPIPRTLGRRLVRAGAAEPQAVSQGMDRLAIPVGVSGMVGPKRMRLARRSLGLDDVRVFATGAASKASSAAADPVVPGGNLGASLSYGDVSTVGLGTATLVCGDDVVGFGHPMTWAGPTTLSMHNLNTIYIQSDPLSPGFKVANASAPIGGITNDRRAGIAGSMGAAHVPDTTTVTSRVTAGSTSRNGSTFISFRDAIPDLAAMHLLSNQDVVFDSIGKGSATVGWTISGTRAGGRTFSVTRTDKYVSDFDISFETTWDLFEALHRITTNDAEKVTIDAVGQTSAMSQATPTFAVNRVRIRQGGRWLPLGKNPTLVVRPGQVKRFLVDLTSADLGRAKVRIGIRMPQHRGLKFGTLDILGGNSFFDESGFFGEFDFFGGVSGPGETLDEALAAIKSRPRNDQVLASLHLFRNNGSTIEALTKRSAPAVTAGGVSIAVESLGSTKRRRGR